MKNSSSIIKSKETERRGPGDGSSSRLLNRISAQIATVIAPAVIILALVSFGFLVFYPVSLQPAAKDRKIVEKLIPITEDKSFKFGEDENYLFNTPVRLEITDENIFVLDSLDHRLQVYDLNGKYVKSIGRRGKGPAEFNSPEGLFIEPGQKNIYVADTRNLRLQVLDFEGKEISTFQLTFPPVGVAVFKNKIYLLAFPSNALIMKDEPLIKIFGPGFSPVATCLKPSKTSDLTLNILANQFILKKDRAGQLVCARQFGLNQIQVYDENGQLNRNFEIIYKGNSVASPGLDLSVRSDLDAQKIAYLVADMAIDSQNNYYFLAGNTGLKPDGLPERGREIYKYNAQGKYQATIILPEKAVLISFGPDDSLYLIDSNYCLRKFKLG
ncbi:MAG: 6-bladed beta-propeller [Candidatus Aminicenantales bacterium]